MGGRSVTNHTPRPPPLQPTAAPPLLHTAARVAAAPLFAALILAPGPALYAVSLGAAKAAAVAASAAFAAAAALATAPVWLLAALALAAVAHAASAPAVAEARRLRASLAEHSETLAGIDRGLTVSGGGGSRGGGWEKKGQVKPVARSTHARPPPSTSSRTRAHTHTRTHTHQILYSHVDNVATLQLETSRRAAALRAELDAALAALLGDDGVADLKAAAADAASAARRARLSDADAAARLAGVRRAWVFAVVTAFAWARVGAPRVGGGQAPASPKSVLALPAPRGGVAGAAPVEAASPYAAADVTPPEAAAAGALLGLLPFLKGLRRQGRA